MKQITAVYTVLGMIFLSTGCSICHADDLEARKIMEKVNDRDDGDNQMSDMTMVLIDKNNNQRRRQLKVFSKDKGKDTLTLMFFVYPSDVKNTGFLTHDFDDPSKDDNQWLYLPALKKTKRIATSDKSGSFMGSDMNYSDMTKRALKDYEFKFYEKGKQKKVENADTWVIWCVPRSEQIAEETGYDKVLVFVRQDNFIVTRSLAWEQGTQYLKFFDVETLEKIDEIWVATQVSIIRKKGKSIVHKTILNLENVRFNQDLSESLFTIRKMETGL
ncbi:MAG: outer membrane lipoprotein-sorting protein [Proteobacteria bacterium]|nr:outer membrane lipoprotein-sorting protein [Pseudomonadota bacterium]MBU1581642.1 outer membrane lipoprotein-sorting protein [Pseudomonadota bacterium]MBU2627868.1 outer membrane lipoprotein-sorting protein [Pseudomonadota bacterium]